MKLIVNACLAFLALGADAFSPLPKFVHQPRRATHQSWGASSKTLLSSATTDSVESSKKEAAKDALEKLLERQRADLAQTERLLQVVSNEKASDLDDSSRELEIVKSITAGVDYGFVSRSEGATRANINGNSSSETTSATPFEGYYGPPANVFSLGIQQFMRNLDAIRGEYKDEDDIPLTPLQEKLQAQLEQLTLNSTAIWERETADGPIDAPYVIKIPYIVLCYLLDVVFEGRYVPSRFFLLETVARMPYFSYISMLHLYETLGFWRRSADVKRVHFAEEWNEFHHLLIMESIGGDQAWWVRFLSQHSAIVYYWVLCFLWLVSPTLAYKFSDLLESHAVNTYGQFLDENEELLKEMPPSVAAVEYYSFGAFDPLFGEYQTTAHSNGQKVRQPGDKMQSLYDVFSAIRADEADHVSTMKACLDPDVAVNSPSVERKFIVALNMLALVGLFVGAGDLLGSGIADNAAIVDDASSASTVVDAALAGATGLAEQVVTDAEEGDVAGLGTDIAEAGSIGVLAESLKKAAVNALEVLAAVFGL